MISPEILKWFPSYLRGRQQSVLAGYSFSGWCDVKTLASLKAVFYLHFYSAAGELQFYCQTSVENLSDAIDKLRMSSDHRVGGRHTLRLPRRGLHSRTRLLQRPSVLRQIWPAHCHFSLLILRAMSVTLVLSRITSFLILSARETPSIARSIACCTLCAS